MLSTAVYLPYLGVSSALRAYVDFYTAVFPYRDTFVVGEFRDITERLGSVIRRVNDTFGTDFAEYDPGPETDDVVFSIIDLGDERSIDQRARDDVLLGRRGTGGVAGDPAARPGPRAGNRLGGVPRDGRPPIV